MKLRIIALAVVVGLLIAGVAVVLTWGDDDAPAVAPSVPTDEERRQMTPEERGRAHLDELADGDHHGRLLTIDAATVTFRIVEVLRGSAAVDAAREEGQLAEGESLPGDIYARDTFQTLTLPVAGDGGFRILSCPNGCELVGTTLDALVAGEAVPHGSPNAIFRFTVAGGTVVSMEEIPQQ